jgi:hypothetical protein
MNSIKPQTVEKAKETQSQVTEELSDLKITLNRLEGLLSELHEKLLPVLLDDFPKEAEKSVNPVSPDLVPLAQDIRGVNVHSNYIYVSILSIINQIRL